MRIGVPKEIKNNENRIGMTPEGVRLLVGKGNEIAVERGAGEGSGFSDKEYESAGARVVSRKEAWNSELVVKVKEPQEEEYRFFRENQIIFSYIHLTGSPKALTKRLIDSGATAIAYETVEENGILPLLAPMSEIAGRLSVHVGSMYLMKPPGEMGILLDSIGGGESGKVVIFGGGNVGEAAARAALALGSHVTLFDIKKEKLDELKSSLADDKFNPLLSEQGKEDVIRKHVYDADLLIGAVLVPGARAPKVVTEDMVKGMKKGSVIADVAIDQGGCIETSRPTSHKNPVFVKHGVIHYCVTNMPASVPRTATLALTRVTLPYVEKIASGLENALKDPSLAKGVNIHRGHVTCKPVADFFGKPYKGIEELV